LGGVAFGRDFTLDDRDGGGNHRTTPQKADKYRTINAPQCLQLFGMPTPQDIELMAQNQDFGLKSLARTEAITTCGKQQPEQRNHRPST
jgi:hypothetical protein